MPSVPPSQGEPSPHAPRSRRRLLLAAVLALTAVTAFALSAGGGAERRTGTAEVPSPSAAPAVRASRVLALRAPDPQGGPPWALRLVVTLGGYLCVQVGRVEHGSFGELGLDGAFNDDERFHAVGPGQMLAVREPGEAETADCAASGRTFAAEINGLDRSGVHDPPAAALPSSDRRRVSYGLLGPNALSITYTSGGRSHTRAVSGPLGAYLLVQPLAAKTPLRIALTYGSSKPGHLFPAGPTGALTATTYRYGSTVCTDDGVNDVHRLCHLREEGRATRGMRSRPQRPFVTVAFAAAIHGRCGHGVTSSHEATPAKWRSRIGSSASVTTGHMLSEQVQGCQYTLLPVPWVASADVSCPMFDAAVWRFNPTRGFPCTPSGFRFGAPVCVGLGLRH